MKTMKAVGDMDKFTVHAGLAMGYRSIQDFETALVYAKKAKEIAPTGRLKMMAENFIGILEQATNQN